MSDGAMSGVVVLRTNRISVQYNSKPCTRKLGFIEWEKNHVLVQYDKAFAEK